MDWWSLGEGFTWDSDNLDEDRATAVEAWRHARSLLETASHRLVVFDEVTYPVNWGWLDVEDVATAIRDRSSKVNVVLTGRNAPDQLIAVADTVTEMHNVKHAYETGLRALKGIDY